MEEIEIASLSVQGTRAIRRLLKEINTGFYECRIKTEMPLTVIIKPVSRFKLLARTMDPEKFIKPIIIHLNRKGETENIDYTIEGR